MAEERKKRRLQKTQTVREKKEKAGAAPEKPRHFRSALGKLKAPLQKAVSVGRKEYYLPLPDNKLGRFLNKRRSFMPRFFKEAWAELRQVNWPGSRETAKLSFAVFVFAVIFGGLIAGVDYVLEIIFRRILLQ